MRRHREFHPELNDCVLEERVAPVVSNLGIIVLTTSGYVLLIPYPGAFASPSGIGGSSGPSLANGVSGLPINTPFFVLGSGGISSVQPGNITGVPSLAAGGPGQATATAAALIGAGTGANSATSSSIPVVTRNTVANDRLNPLPVIGGVSRYQSAFAPVDRTPLGMTLPAVTPSTPTQPAQPAPSGPTALPPTERRPPLILPSREECIRPSSRESPGRPSCRGLRKETHFRLPQLRQARSPSGVGPGTSR